MTGLFSRNGIYRFLVMSNRLWLCFMIRWIFSRGMDDIQNNNGIVIYLHNRNIGKSVENILSGSDNFSRTGSFGKLLRFSTCYFILVYTDSTTRILAFSR